MAVTDSPGDAPASDPSPDPPGAGNLPRSANPSADDAEITRLLGTLRNAAGHRGGPVFVDSSGRRGRTVRRLGWLSGLLCAGYALVLVLSLVGGSAVAPSLLIPDEEKRGPSAVPPTASAPRSPSGSATEMSPPSAVPGPSRAPAATPGGPVTAERPGDAPSSSAAPSAGEQATGSGTAPVRSPSPSRSTTPAATTGASPDPEETGEPTSTPEPDASGSPFGGLPGRETGE